MQHSFWHERWQSGVIPFHEGALNQMLRHWFDALHLEANAQVFVPLCGKAFDMRWLLEQQCRVLGVEISDLAVREFFSEHDLPMVYRRGERFESFEGPDLQILCGDFFDITSPDLATVSAVYDRASLVALPELDRRRYAGHMLSHLPTGAAILLVSFEYDVTRMNGPPFSVSEAEARALYESRYTIAHLESTEVIESKPIFQERGLESIIEHAFLCTDQG